MTWNLAIKKKTRTKSVSNKPPPPTVPASPLSSPSICWMSCYEQPNDQPKVQHGDPSHGTKVEWQQDVAANVAASPCAAKGGCCAVEWHAIRTTPYSNNNNTTYNSHNILACHHA